jgi:hypothetical protein
VRCAVTSQSPRRILQIAYDAARRPVPAHRNKFRLRKPPQPELLACLVVKEFLRLDYRGFATHLIDHPDLASQINMKALTLFITF